MTTSEKIKKARDEYNSAKAAVEEAEIFGLETKTLNNQLDLAKSELEARNYWQVLQYSHDIKNKAEELKQTHNKTFEMMSTAAKSIAECQGYHVPCVEAIEELLAARNAYESRADYNKALVHAQRALDYSKNALTNHSKDMQELGKVAGVKQAASENLTVLLEKFGKNPDIGKEVKQLYTNAMSAYKSGNYAGALEKSNSAIAKLD